MTAVFIVCAAAGATVLVIQFLLTLIGLGGHAFDAGDVPHDVGHGFGGDLHGGDLDADGGADLHGDAADAHAAGQPAHGATWLFGVLSFRTVTAALAFFGLAGLAAQSAELSTWQTLLAAVVAGGLAMVAVYWMMCGLCELRAEGTVRVQRAVGRQGTVYVRVPPHGSGNGKIQINLQNRTMEYLAVTSGPELPTGTRVVVVDIVNPTTLEVQALENNDHE